jgi:flagellar biosynthesis anti-sigma factor FlgM
MKIYDLNLTGGAAATGAGRAQEAQKSNQSSNVNSGAAGGVDDRVEFSSSLGRLSKALSAYGSARSSRVQALAAQYQSGTYRADAAAISRGMVSEAIAAAQ